MATSVDPLTTNQACDHWLEAAEEVGADTGAYHPLRHALGELLPADAEFGIGYQEEVPVILALTKDRLICLSAKPPAGEGEDHPVRATSIPLDAACRVSLESRLEVLRQGTWTLRFWTIAGPWPGALEVTTKAPRNSSFLTDRHGEAVMRKVTERLGWPLPRAAA